MGNEIREMSEVLTDTFEVNEAKKINSIHSLAFMLDSLVESYLGAFNLGKKYIDKALPEGKPASKAHILETQTVLFKLVDHYYVMPSMISVMSRIFEPLFLQTEKLLQALKANSVPDLRAVYEDNELVRAKVQKALDEILGLAKKNSKQAKLAQKTREEKEG